MVNGAFQMMAGALDFGMKRSNARAKLLDRQRVEIKPGKRLQRIARAPGDILFGLHGAQR